MWKLYELQKSTQIKTGIYCVVNLCVKNLCMTWAEKRSCHRKIHLFTSLLHMFRISVLLSVTLLFIQVFMFQPTQWTELSGWEIAPAECFLRYIAVQKMDLHLFSAFLFAFYPQQSLLTGATFWRSYSLSSLHPCSLKTILGFHTAHRESPFMFWDYLGYLLLAQDEETRGHSKQKESVRKKCPPVVDSFSSMCWIRAEKASRVYLNPQLWNPFFSERFLRQKHNALQKK